MRNVTGVCINDDLGGPETLPCGREGTFGLQKGTGRGFCNIQNVEVLDCASAPRALAAAELASAVQTRARMGCLSYLGAAGNWRVRAERARRQNRSQETSRHRQSAFVGMVVGPTDVIDKIISSRLTGSRLAAAKWGHFSHGLKAIDWLRRGALTKPSVSGIAPSPVPSLAAVERRSHPPSRGGRSRTSPPCEGGSRLLLTVYTVCN